MSATVDDLLDYMQKHDHQYFAVKAEVGRITREENGPVESQQGSRGGRQGVSRPARTQRPRSIFRSTRSPAQRRRKKRSGSSILTCSELNGVNWSDENF